jgi:hypothetical protein
VIVPVRDLFARLRGPLSLAQGGPRAYNVCVVTPASPHPAARSCAIAQPREALNERWHSVEGELSAIA